ncbi:sugar ABC transporter substrate-binding protein [Vogesella sp. LIG4]|uniref:sugar ABC transporter substrate-binding protein n=1 Tax=Vogesella sp. LIG4 TaxID=1192162 RepID=UPI00081FFD5A|nr:sugar ABC transporter substrate-binding protein [Vogesella sp. LIG4]SCK22803.1 monosaccharide ABC transporter substrate-binding protein, CUT2 family [Vogesella sp. LIG4]
MKRFIKHAASLTLFALAMQALPASAARLGVTMATFDNNFLTILRNNMQKAASGKPGVSLQLEDAQNDVGRQISQVQNFIAQKVDAIIVSSVDTSTTPKLTRLAQAAGIPLVYVNRMPSDKTLPAKVAFVGSDDAVSGTIQMKEVCRLLNGKGNVAIVMGDLATQEARLRTRFEEEVVSKAPCNGIKVVEKQSAKWSRTEGRDLVMNWLTAGLKFDAIIANNDEMALGAIQALKSANKLGNTVVAGIDATQDALGAMKAGEMKVTVFQDAAAQGKGAVEAALKLAAGEKVPAMIWVPYELVTPANYKGYLSRN